MRARASKGSVPNADGATGTTHLAAGHGAPLGVPGGGRIGRGGSCATTRWGERPRPRSFGRSGGPARRRREQGVRDGGGSQHSQLRQRVSGIASRAVTFLCERQGDVWQTRRGRCSRVSRTAGDTVSGVWGQWRGYRTRSIRHSACYHPGGNNHNK